MNNFVLPTVHIQTAEGVNTSDYYSDVLLSALIPYLNTHHQPPREIFELGTGRGYISIILSRLFPSAKIIASDIEVNAIQLAKRNVQLNNLNDRITVIQGSLFKPIPPIQFDLIVAVPPQLPLTKTQVKNLGTRVPSYHVTTSAGGKTGRTILDALIAQAPQYLKYRGMLVFVHSDIINFTTTLHKLAYAGFGATILKTQKKLLEETTLTRLTKYSIEQTGYRFKKDKTGKEFITLGVIVGIYGDSTH